MEQGYQGLAKIRLLSLILSYHPIYEADLNLTCAGRQPDREDLAAIRRASAVILPQGCNHALYQMAMANCPRVFPAFGPRFDYPGKVGQARLFEKTGTLHPATMAFNCLADFFHTCGKNMKSPFEFPLVFKLDWGGEGDNVLLVENQAAFHKSLERAAEFEKSGHRGFVIQQYVNCRNRCLRVVVIGQRYLSYWRCTEMFKPATVNLAQGAYIDHVSAACLQTAGRRTVKAFCSRTGIELAGFDLLFSENELAAGRIRPLLLEINYFFGRRGLGGSENFYRILIAEINGWLQRCGLQPPAKAGCKNI